MSDPKALYDNFDDDCYSYYNTDGSFFLAQEFKSEHRSARLIGKFVCFYYKAPKEDLSIGWWRFEHEETRTSFWENDHMDRIFQGKSLKAFANHLTSLDFRKATKLVRDIEQIKIINQENIRRTFWSDDTKENDGKNGFDSHAE